MTTTIGKARDLITFSRGTLATVTDSDGRIKWAPHNLLTNSEQFDAATWQQNNVTVSANSINAPNGTKTADLVLETAATGVHNCGRSVTTDAANYTLSCFMKAGTRNFGFLYHTQTNAAVSVNLTTGATGQPSTTVAPISSSVTPLSDGWYLVSMTVLATAASNSFGIYISDSLTGLSYAGDITKGIYLWGAHLYRADLGGMQANPSAYPYYNPSTPKNLLGFSEAFDNAAWSKNGLLAFGSGSVANAIAAPNGSLSADKIVESTANTTHVVIQDVATAASPYTFSAYMKAAGRNWGVLYNVTASRYASFNLSTGTVGFTSAGTTASITSVGDGWYRCSITGAATAATNSFRIYIADADNSTTYTGDGVSGIYLWGAQLSDSASLDAYSPTFGSVTAAAAYHGPRLDYDPATLSAKGLLVEEQRTNVVPNSNVFNVAAWSKGAGGTAVAPVVTAADAVAPDGTLTAQKVVFDRGAGNTVTDNSVLSTAISGVAATTSYIGSVYIKAATAGDVGKQVGWRHVAGGSYGVITLTADWQRVTRTETSFSTSSSIEFVSRGTVTTDNSVGAHIWGVSVEVGASNAATAFPTSLIPTGASTATRNADVASVGVSQFPYNASEGTIVINATGTGAYLYAFSGPDNSGNNALYAYAATNYVTQAYNGGALQANIDSGVVAGAAVKLGAAYASNNFAAVANGGTVTPDTTYSQPSVDKLRLGVTPNGTVAGQVYIRQITYIPRRLANAELQARTA